GQMPTTGRLGASPGLSLRASSIFTYSAVARVSSSASTRPPKGRTLVCNADPGRPLLLGQGFRSAGIPWNYSSSVHAIDEARNGSGVPTRQGVGNVVGRADEQGLQRLMLREGLPHGDPELGAAHAHA